MYDLCVFCTEGPEGDEWMVPKSYRFWRRQYKAYSRNERTHGGSWLCTTFCSSTWKCSYGCHPTSLGWSQRWKWMNSRTLDHWDACTLESLGTLLPSTSMTLLLPFTKENIGGIIHHIGLAMLPPLVHAASRPHHYHPRGSHLD